MNDENLEDDEAMFNLLVMNFWMDKWAEHQARERELGLAGS
jgi:hypothetical protein